MNALSAIPTGNLVVATPWISSRPILTDAETIQKIQNIFTRAGVAPEIATRFTSSLTNRILEINKNLIQKLGSQDIGNQLANSILKKYLTEIQDELVKDSNISRGNLHNVGSLILGLVSDTKEILADLKNKTTIRNINTLRKAVANIVKDVITPAPQRQLPDWSRVNQGGAVSEVLQGRIMEAVAPLEPDIDYKIVDEDVDVEFPDPDIDRRDPSGLPVGNVIVNDGSAIARILRGWGEGNDIIRTRGYRISYDPLTQMSLTAEIL